MDYLYTNRHDLGGRKVVVGSDGSIESITIIATINSRLGYQQRKKWTTSDSRHTVVSSTTRNVQSFYFSSLSSNLHLRWIAIVFGTCIVTVILFTFHNEVVAYNDATNRILKSLSTETTTIIENSTLIVSSTTSASTSSTTTTTTTTTVDNGNTTHTMQSFQSITSRTSIRNPLMVSKTNESKSYPSQKNNTTSTTVVSNNTRDIYKSDSMVNIKSDTNPTKNVETNISSSSNITSATTQTNAPTPTTTTVQNVIVTPIVFERWNSSVPCYVPEDNWKSVTVQKTPTNTGILYLKTHKTGSSTCAGINLRIARNVARRIMKQRELGQQQQQQQQQLVIVVPANEQQQNNNIERNYYDTCRSRFQHGKAAMLFPNRTKVQQQFDYTNNNIDFITNKQQQQQQQQQNRSLLWTVIRNPTERVVSSFFHFAVSRNGVSPTDFNFTRYVKQRSISVDYYLRFLYTEGNFTRNNNYTNIDNSSSTTNRTHEQVINSILNTYDFIGITERMDESAVLLMMLFNLRMSDVLYLRSKTRGGYDGGGGTGSSSSTSVGIKSCTLIRPSFISPGMKKFFQSENWINIIKYDQMLYDAVNKSLDMTIDHLGRNKFQEQLVKFRHALQSVEDNCRNSTVFPCDSTGKSHSHNETDCLWSDSGCGTSCLDTVSTQLGLW